MNDIDMKPVVNKKNIFFIVLIAVMAVLIGLGAIVFFYFLPKKPEPPAAILFEKKELPPCELSLKILGWISEGTQTWVITKNEEGKLITLLEKDNIFNHQIKKISLNNVILEPHHHVIWLSTEKNDYKNKLHIFMNNIPLKNALMILSDFCGKNFLMHHVKEEGVSLKLNETRCDEVLPALLKAYDLSSFEEKTVTVIAPNRDIDRYKAHQPFFSRCWRLHHAQSTETLALMKHVISKKGMLQQDARLNYLFAYDDEIHLKRMDDMLQQLDQPLPQIQIEARIASVDQTFEEELGLHFKNEFSEDVKNQFTLTLVNLTKGYLDIALAALEKKGHGQLISRPSLMTHDGKTALIESGEEIPYQEVSKSGATSVAFKKAVLSMEVTPKIVFRDTLMVALRVNQDKPSNREVLGVPIIQTRHIETQVKIKSGQTVVLGGIYEENTGKDREAIPWLGNIPGLHAVFGHHRFMNDRRELLIFLTPRLVSERKK